MFRTKKVAKRKNIERASRLKITKKILDSVQGENEDQPDVEEGGSSLPIASIEAEMLPGINEDLTTSKPGREAQAGETSHKHISGEVVSAPEKSHPSRTRKKNNKEDNDARSNHAPSDTRRTSASTSSSVTRNTDTSKEYKKISMKNFLKELDHEKLYAVVDGPMNFSDFIESGADSDEELSSNSEGDDMMVELLTFHKNPAEPDGLEIKGKSMKYRDALEALLNADVEDDDDDDDKEETSP